MLRRRYYAKEKIAGKTKGRQKAHASVRDGSGTQRSVYRCAENGFLTYDFPGGLDSCPLESCLSFTGHRFLSEAEKQRISRILPPILETYVQAGKNVFLSGGALGFDTLTAQAVISLRNVYPVIRLMMILPCRSQASRWSAADRDIHAWLLTQADGVHYTSEEYFPGCMQKRNHFLVDHADTCLCYLRNCRGGTWNTVSYAWDRGRTIRNLATE